MNDSSLSQWVTEYKTGNKEHAMEVIYQGTFSHVYKYVFKHIGHRQATEDIVSDTYLTFIDIIDRYDGSSRLTTFLIGIAHNKLRQHWQKNPYQIDIDELTLGDPLTTSDPDPFSEPDNERSDQLRPYLNDIMQQLSERYQIILNLRFYECNNIPETARKLGITEQNVRVLQHRALKKAADIASNMNINVS